MQYEKGLKQQANRTDREKSDRLIKVQPNVRPRKAKQGQLLYDTQDFMIFIDGNWVDLNQSLKQVVDALEKRIKALEE